MADDALQELILQGLAADVVHAVAKLVAFTTTIADNDIPITTSLTALGETQEAMGASSGELAIAHGQLGKLYQLRETALAERRATRG